MIEDRSASQHESEIAVKATRFKHPDGFTVTISPNERVIQEFVLDTAKNALANARAKNEPVTFDIAQIHRNILLKLPISDEIDVDQETISLSELVDQNNIDFHTQLLFFITCLYSLQKNKCIKLKKIKIGTKNDGTKYVLCENKSGDRVVYDSTSAITAQEVAYLTQEERAEYNIQMNTREKISETTTKLKELFQGWWTQGDSNP